VLFGSSIVCVLVILCGTYLRNNYAGGGVAAIFCCQCAEEERHDILRVVKFFLPLPVFWLLFYNMLSLWTFTAKHMDRRIWGMEIAAGTVSSLNALFDIMLIPIAQFLIYPWLRRCGFTLKAHHRIATGMLFAVGAMVAAGLVQLYVDKDSLPGDTDSSTATSASSSLRAMELLARASAATPGVSVAWQVPQYLLISIAEVLISITALEFAYEQAPGPYKGLVMAVFCLCQAVGNLLLAVVTLSHFASRAVQYFAMGGLMLFAAILFMLYTVDYDYRRESARKQPDLLADEDGPEDG